KTGLNTYCVNSHSYPSYELLCQGFNKALKTDDLKLVQKNLINLKDDLVKDTTAMPESVNQLTNILLICDQLLNKRDPAHATGWFPLIEWNGAHNQYHQWMSGLLLQRPL